MQALRRQIGATMCVAVLGLPPHDTPTTSLLTQSNIDYWKEKWKTS